MPDEVCPPNYLFTKTQDWFSFNIDRWRGLFPRIATPSPRVLEIGSWEGRSAVFLLTELCKDGGEIVCIDHFDLMSTAAGRERHRKLTHNLALTGRPSRVLAQFSVPALMALLTEEMGAARPGYDWVYVDGSHEADDTLLDGELAWRLARKGAVVIFDDYHWDKEPEESMHHPKRGIDAFLALHRGEYELLSAETESQVVIQKTAEMRIGFLVAGEESKEGLEGALGYRVNVVLTIDAGYAIAAAVAIRSAAMHTRGGITFYVANTGLPEDVMYKLRQSLPEGVDATIVFVDLSPSEHRSALPPGPTWDKIAMIPRLPVERVLYLDADVLVRSDLRELWDTDLQGKPIAAAVDVGFPAGHTEGPSASYFNAGVLLMDLAAIRARLGELNDIASAMKGAKMQDQDALNVHFDGKWVPLSLRWNAQGLGTYAAHRTPEREALAMDEMEDPKIVHFTGALHPTMAAVINPFVQPYTGKPWGYAGAPGHPFAEEWWEVCEQTAWHGWRASGEFRELKEKKMEEAAQVGLAVFKDKSADASS
ncbi:glycosyl transferase [Lenzites betulinus]|nr:glycosyl transferase [Lenzites betulinus]